jgi:hypothetical protein
VLKLGISNLKFLLRLCEWVGDIVFPSFFFFWGSCPFPLVRWLFAEFFSSHFMYNIDVNIQYLYGYLISTGMKLLSIHVHIQDTPKHVGYYIDPHLICLYEEHLNTHVLTECPNWKKINTSTQLVCENGHTHPTWVHTPSMLTCTRMRIYGPTVSNQLLKTSHANDGPINYMPPNPVVYIEFLIC